VGRGNGVDSVGGLGAAVTEQLVVSGMKLTPCSPTILQARDTILQAGVNNINAGANRSAIFAAFAHRLMGAGAESPADNSPSTIFTSSDVPIECGGHGGVTVTRDFISTDVPKSIPDNPLHRCQQRDQRPEGNLRPAEDHGGRQHHAPAARRSLDPGDR
jgi:hypothetical protein